VEGLALARVESEHLDVAADSGQQRRQRTVLLGSLATDLGSILLISFDH
jgi:hypothetical protein